jgi:hypothetical protein
MPIFKRFLFNGVCAYNGSTLCRRDRTPALFLRLGRTQPALCPPAATTHRSGREPSPPLAGPFNSLARLLTRSAAAPADPARAGRLLRQVQALCATQSGAVAAELPQAPVTVPSPSAGTRSSDRRPRISARPEPGPRPGPIRVVQQPDAPTRLGALRRRTPSFAPAGPPQPCLLPRSRCWACLPQSHSKPRTDPDPARSDPVP